MGSPQSSPPVPCGGMKSPFVFVLTHAKAYIVVMSKKEKRRQKVVNGRRYVNVSIEEAWIKAIC